MLSAQFLKFLVIGGVGFVTDGGILYLLVRMGYAPELCRLVSFPVAVTVTWQLNRIWTFQQEGGPAAASKTYPGYFMVQTLGAFINFGVFLLVMQFAGRSPEGALIGFTAGSLAGLFFNFFALRRFVFRPEDDRIG